MEYLELNIFESQKIRKLYSSFIEEQNDPNFRKMNLSKTITDKQGILWLLEGNRDLFMIKNNNLEYKNDTRKVELWKQNGDNFSPNKTIHGFLVDGNNLYIAILDETLFLY